MIGTKIHWLAGLEINIFLLYRQRLKTLSAHLKILILEDIFFLCKYFSTGLYILAKQTKALKALF